MFLDRVAKYHILLFHVQLNKLKLLFFKIKGKSNGGFSKLFVASHNLSSTAVLVKQTDIDDQNDEQLDLLKVSTMRILISSKFLLSRIAQPWYQKII